MYIKKTSYTNTPEFLASAHFINFTTTVSDEGVVADENGKKIVKAGTVLPANDATAKGILFHDVDVTYGPQPAALMVEGYVLEERLPEPLSVEAKTALKEIKLR